MARKLYHMSMSERFNNLALLARCAARFALRGPSKKTAHNPKSVVIVQFGKLGDMVCTTPMFRAIQKALPDTRVIVVGDKKPFISALITLDPEMLPVWLNNVGEDAAMSIAQAAKNPKVLAEIQKAIDTANTAVSRAESIRKFTILEKDLTEAGGHLTPKLSIKRDVILRDFAGVIEGMYNESPATEGISVTG